MHEKCADKEDDGEQSSGQELKNTVSFDVHYSPTDPVGHCGGALQSTYSPEGPWRFIVLMCQIPYEVAHDGGDHEGSRCLGAS